MNHSTGAELIHWLQTPNAGQKVEINGLTVTLRFVAAASNGDCAVVELYASPDFTGHWPHVHRHTTELFYVISGELAFTLGAETMIARQGAAVLVRPGVPHHFWNPGAIAARALAVLTPGGPEQYYVELAAVLAQGAVESASLENEMAALAAKYDHFPALS